MTVRLSWRQVSDMDEVIIKIPKAFFLSPQWASELKSFFYLNGLSFSLQNRLLSDIQETFFMCKEQFSVDVEIEEKLPEKAEYLV